MISILVPVYNVEPYIEKCLESILAQTYSNIEVILVDDASTDLSCQICEAYAARDQRMQLIHFQINRGVSAARNEAVSRARGEYITFMDPDDYAEPDLVEKLYANLIENKADISICGITYICQETPASVYSSAEAVRCLARKKPFLWNLWGKLFVAESVKRCSFSEGVVCGEDLLFFYQILKGVNKVSYMPDKMYHYLYRRGSLTNSGIDEKRCTVLFALDYICADASADFPEAVSWLHLLSLDTCACLALQAVEEGTNDRNVFEYLKIFQKKIRQHFSWKVFFLCREKKIMVSVLLLHVSAAAFWISSAVYKRSRRFVDKKLSGERYRRTGRKSEV